MPRRRSRFSALNRQLRAVGGSPTGTGPVSEYFKYITGQKNFTVPNAISAEARELFQIAVIPFGFSAATTNPSERTVCTISAYSYAGLQTRSQLGLDKFGIYNETAGARINPNFFPALIRATYTRGGATTNENKVSGITNNVYKYTPRRTFSFPFGRTLSAVDAETGDAETSIANVDEIDVLQVLQRALLAGGSPAPQTPASEDNRALSVSYVPEEYQSPRSGSDAPSNAPPGVTVN